MVSAIASRKYERAALSRLFRFTLAIQPTVRAEHRSDRRGHHVADEVFWPLGVFPNGQSTLSLGRAVLIFAQLPGGSPIPVRYPRPG